MSKKFICCNVTASTMEEAASKAYRAGFASGYICASMMVLVCLNNARGRRQERIIERVHDFMQRRMDALLEEEGSPEFTLKSVNLAAPLGKGGRHG